MAKSPEAFRTISEVADWLGVQAHVLRFWESKFTHVKPVKRAGGRRYYRPADMLLLGGIKKLLHDDGMTIKGVQKTLREQGASYVADHSPSLDDLTMAQLDDEISVVRAESQPTPIPVEASEIKDVASEGDVTESPVEAEPEEEDVPVEPSSPVTDSSVQPVQTQDPAAQEPTVSEEMATAEPETEEPELTSGEPEAAEPEEITDEPEVASAEPEAAAPKEIAEEQQEPEAEAEPGPEPELEFLKESEREPEPETATALPSFMHKPTVVPEPDPTPVPVAKVPLIVDAPDGPPEDQIEVPPGLLARVSTLERIPASQIDQMRAIRAQLETLHTRLSGTGKE